MSDADTPIPPKVLAATGILLAVIMILAIVGRFTGIGQSKLPTGEVVRTMQLRFADANDGAVIVTRPDGQSVARLEPGSNGFVRGVVRSLVRARRLDRIEADPPFRLTQWSSRRLTIDDPATGLSIDVTGFGRDNHAAFARLLAANATMAAGRNAQGPGRLAPERQP